MFIKLFYTLRTYGVPVSTRELLDLNAALDQGLMMQPHPENPELSTFASREDMYRLIRLCMVILISLIGQWRIILRALIVSIWMNYCLS